MELLLLLLLYPYLTRKAHRPKGPTNWHWHWHWHWHLASYDCQAVTLLHRSEDDEDDHPSSSAVGAVRVGKVADHRYLRNTLYSRGNSGTTFHSMYS